jgi:hypothetical protein
MLTINWIIAVIGTILGIIGLIHMILASNRMKGQLKSAISFLTIPLALLIGFSLVMGYLISGCKDISHGQNVWIPAIYTIAMLLFAYGAMKLLSVVKSVK